MLIALAMLLSQSMTFDIRLTVPAICEIQQSQILCNTDRRYVVYVRNARGEIRAIEQGRGPVYKNISHRLAQGEVFILELAED